MNNCRQCGKPVPLKYKSQKRTFCNRECLAKYQTIDVDIKEMQRLYGEGLSQREVGEKLGVSMHVINARMCKYGYAEE